MNGFLRQIYLPLLFLLLLAPTSNAQVKNGEMLLYETNGSWASLIVKVAADTRYRTMGMDTTNSIGLIVDAYSGDCSYEVSVGISFGKEPLEQNIKKNLLITTRVDDKEPFFLGGVYNGFMGDTTGFIVINQFDAFPRFIREMQGGNTIRMRVDDSNGNPMSTAAFKLNGFTYSLNRAFAMCEKAKSGRGNQDRNNQVLPPHPGARAL